MFSKIMVSKLQKRRNHNIFEAIAIKRKKELMKNKNKTGLTSKPVKSLKGKSELRL